MLRAKMISAEQTGQIMGTDLSSLQKNLLISLQIKYTKPAPKTSKQTKKQTQIGHYSL